MIDRASARVAAGLFLVIIFMLVGLGLLARMQMPVEVATAGNIVNTDTQSNAADNASNAEADNAADSASETEAGTEGKTDAQEAEAQETEAQETEADDTSTNDAQADDQSAGETDAEVSPVADEASQTEDATDDDASVETATPDSDEPSDAADTHLTPDELVMAFAAGGCSSCHVIPDITGAVGQLGPDLSTIGTVAASRVEGLPAEEYIRQSLLEPNAYIVSECPTGPCLADLMQPANLDALSPDEMDGIVAYMLASTDQSASAATGSETTETEAASVPVEAEPVAVDLDAVAAVITKGTCGACHVIPGIDSAVGVLGPDLSAIGAAAATRIEGYSAEDYLRESIMDPNAFIAPECPTGDCLPNIMLPNLAELLTEEEIGTIINYLATLDGQG